MTATHSPSIVVVGGGLAGSEAAWQLARRGYGVKLVEKRPGVPSPAHRSEALGELVCSNSLGANELSSPGGILKAELRRLGSLILACADATAVPAGRALAVDRELFSRRITAVLSTHPRVEICREECEALPPEPCIVATGPLTEGRLAEDLKRRTGGFLSFYDAISPVVTAESLDRDVVFRASRWGKGDDYLNCPLDAAVYQRFVEALRGAERATLHSVD
ncbi:MAG TPA: methylenetetrahydrofolate--tRNA-(uracil(54)-C(5))-methyltransferase (FADH(2)-oxidizing) TrmFO, partial [Synergistaceae bacterium]|nr:methylenetetrahydrofolate--tRNA-(uracil(54)-C(5))-methyltransferase (FADH(2)-oxidizing) TrmFO [Synergistaceae bacterium]